MSRQTVVTMCGRSEDQHAKEQELAGALEDESAPRARKPVGFLRPRAENGGEPTSVKDSEATPVRAGAEDEGSLNRRGSFRNKEA